MQNNLDKTIDNPLSFYEGIDLSKLEKPKTLKEKMESFAKWMEKMLKIS